MSMFPIAPPEVTEMAAFQTEDMRRSRQLATIMIRGVIETPGGGTAEVPYTLYEGLPCRLNPLSAQETVASAQLYPTAKYVLDLPAGTLVNAAVTITVTTLRPNNTPSQMVLYATGQKLPHSEETEVRVLCSDIPAPTG